MTIPIMLDTVAYNSKPDKYISAITSRLKSMGPSEVTAGELAGAIAEGRTFCPACFEANSHEAFGHSKFLGMRLIALDVDNDIVVRDENGKPVKDEQGHEIKRPLKWFEHDFLHHSSAWMRLESLGLKPIFYYHTFSYSQNPLLEKYHVVCDIGETITDANEAHSLIAAMHGEFPECDHSCTNLNRLYFGTSRGRIGRLRKHVTSEVADHA